MTEKCSSPESSSFTTSLLVAGPIQKLPQPIITSEEHCDKITYPQHSGNTIC
jgi:hypothetical protein